MKTVKNEAFAKFRTRIQELEKQEKQNGLSRAQFLEKISTDDKTYRNWINGRDGDITKPSIPKPETLLRIIKAYPDKSIDWLLGESDFTSPEADFIGKATGLSDAAIHNLIADKADADLYGFSVNHLLDIINHLLTSKNGLKILTDIYCYLFGGYDHAATGETSIELRDKTNLPCNGAELEIKNIPAFFLVQITELLSQEKRKIEESGRSDYGKYVPGTSEIGDIWSAVAPFR